MENRFLEMDEHLKGITGRGTGRGVRPSGNGSNGHNGHNGARGGVTSFQSSLWSRPFAALDRALVILIENGGSDLGIPKLADKLLSLLPDSIAGEYRQRLVEFLREKIKGLVDNLAETAELTANRYTAAKPDLYGDVIVLRDGTASYQDLKSTLVNLSRSGKIADVFILTHGSREGTICVEGGITGEMISAMKDDLGKPLSIRSVYMMNCWGTMLNQAWLDAGARVSSGSAGINYLPEPTMFFFWSNWKDGQNFESAVTSAYRKTINLMNEAVRTFVSGLPIPGTSYLAEKIDFTDMDFVKQSFPMIQGQRSLTISSDNLSAAQSVASSLATTVLPVSVLRSLASSSRSISQGQSLSGAVSQQGVDLIKSFEGFRGQMYNDPAGHCTIGYGTLLHKGNCDGRAAEQPYTDGITAEKATELLRQEAEEFQKVINDSVKVALNQNQNDALVSFAYNIGSGAFGKSTLLKLLNQGNYDAVPSEMKKWTKARVNGNVVDLPGLVKRRAAEAELFQRSPGAAAQSLSEPVSVRDSLVALLDRWVGTTEGVTQVEPGKPLFSDFRSDKYLEAQRKAAAQVGRTYSTCVDFMGWALAQAVAQANATLKVSSSILNVNLWYKEKRAHLPAGSWVDFTPGMAERPEPGDIYVLTFAENVYKPGMPKTDANIKYGKGSFSHIGFFRSYSKNEAGEGEQPSETWVSIDGGAGIAGRYKYDASTNSYTLVQKGAEMIERSERLFYPDTNIFPAGVKNQDQGPRRLLGWLKIDKISG